MIVFCVGIYDPVLFDAVLSVQVELYGPVALGCGRVKDFDNQIGRALDILRCNDVASLAGDEENVRLDHGGVRQHYVGGPWVDAPQVSVPDERRNRQHQIAKDALMIDEWRRYPNQLPVQELVAFVVGRLGVVCAGEIGLQIGHIGPTGGCGAGKGG